MSARGAGSRQPTTDALASVIDEVRSTFHVLRAAARDVHGGSELAGGLRGVLFDLAAAGDQTVPTLARKRPVSRQHIQTLVNALLADGLVVLRENPHHKRSKLVSLSATGRSVAKEMAKREQAVLEALECDLTEERLRAAAQVLHDVRALFKGPAWSALVREASDTRP